MTQRLSQHSGRVEDDSAARLQRRLEREYRAREQRKRATIVVASLASLGLLLLVVGGIAITTRATEARGDEQLAATVTDQPAPAAEDAYVPAPADNADDEPVVDPPAVALAAPKESPAEKPPAEKPAKPAAKATKPSAKKKPSTQRFSIELGDYGYEPSVINASSGSPITLTVGKGEGCAAGFIMPSLGIQKDNSGGPVTFSLGKLDAGTYRFSCAMEMVEGRLVVE